MTVFMIILSICSQVSVIVLSIIAIKWLFYFPPFILEILQEQDSKKIKVNKLKLLDLGYDKSALHRIRLKGWEMFDNRAWRQPVPGDRGLSGSGGGGAADCADHDSADGNPGRGSLADASGEC